MFETQSWQSPDLKALIRLPVSNPSLQVNSDTFPVQFTYLLCQFALSMSSPNMMTQMTIITIFSSTRFLLFFLVVNAAKNIFLHSPDSSERLNTKSQLINYFHIGCFYCHFLHNFSIFVAILSVRSSSLQPNHCPLSLICAICGLSFGPLISVLLEPKQCLNYNKRNRHKLGIKAFASSSMLLCFSWRHKSAHTKNLTIFTVQHMNIHTTFTLPCSLALFALLLNVESFCDARRRTKEKSSE